MSDRAEVSENIIDIVAGEMGRNNGDITEDMKLEDDLTIDSLDMVEIVMEIEDDYPELGGIDDRVAAQWVTVKDIVDYVHGKLEQ